MEFAYPWVLLLLLLLPVLALYLLRWKKNPSLVIPSAKPFRATRKKHRLSPVHLLWLLGFALLLVALARPRYGDEKIILRSQGIDIIIAIDLSGSMEAYDIPRNVTTGEELQKLISAGKLADRLEVAKREVRKFISERPNDRIGLIGFADVAYSLAPPTLDHSLLTAHLQNLKTRQLGELTGIASAIASGVNRLKDSDAPRRVLLLFTDGDNTMKNKLTPEQAAELGKEFKVVIHTVGIGGPNAIVAGQDMFGRTRYQQMSGSFNEELLRKIASTTGGSYFHAADADGMKQVMSEINRLEKTTIEQPRYVEYREYAPTLALIALGILALAYLAECTWALRLP